MVSEFFDSFYSILLISFLFFYGCFYFMTRLLSDPCFGFLYRADASDIVRLNTVVLPTIGIGLIGGSLLSKRFRIGCGFGIPSAAVSVFAHVFDIACNGQVKKSKEIKQNYSVYCLRHPIDVCVVSPLLEEIFFRVCLQDAFLKTIISNIRCVPQARASSIALGIASSCFGLAHVPESEEGFEKEFEFRAVSMAISGLILGSVYNKYGLWASIAAHSVHNIAIMGMGTCKISKSLG